MDRSSVLYFHSPCFDGIVSAVLAAEYLEKRDAWRPLTLVAVNYDVRATWLGPLREGSCAVVDFLYHPQARFWVDHHATSFLNDEVRAHFLAREGPSFVYDPNAPSCAGLLRRHLELEFGPCEPRLADLVRWAEKTDGARYDSPDEAVFGNAPALRISAGLALGDGDDYSAGLVRALRHEPLSAVAEMPEVKRRYETVRGRTEAGLRRFRENARLETDGIVVFDVDASDVTVSRYAPYIFFPEARYSAGIVRFPGGAKVTAMRNPWLEFESVPLGPICARLGGGGHRRVGSIALQGKQSEEAAQRLAQLLAELRRAESSGLDRPSHEATAS